LKEVLTINIKIIYEDNHLLVVEKPVNILSQADETGDPDLLTLLKQDIKTRYNKPGEVYLGLLHRLDRPVGGTMVFAKTSKAASRLSDQVRKREFKKTYLAVVRGELEVPSAKLVDFLVKDEKTNTVRVVDENYPGAKEAILEYSVIASRDDLSLVKVKLHTGRSHQIRVQFSNIRNPLYGDQKYGENKNKVGQQIALWSYSIVLMHPTLREELMFKSLPPLEQPWSLFEIE
jgi:23S rRNA pseudouridine1911/1915/1917 synthase